MKFDDKDKEAAAITARADFYFFSRYMFLRRKGFKWLRAPHHKLICDALTKVFNGETTRLIINIPPRYSKTELAVVNFIAWAMGKAPDSEFIHVSYSSDLAANNSSNTKMLMMHEAYGEIFPEVKFLGTAQAHWKTIQGGVMYSAGAGGTLTGFGAGKSREGFGGCFPYDQMIETEIGALKIGDIVTKKIPVRVWSWNKEKQIVELKPIDTFWTNPANKIIEVGMQDGTTFQCTPDHKILTNSGWIEAVKLSNSFDLVNTKTSFLHNLRSGFGSITYYVNNRFAMRSFFHPIRTSWLNVFGYFTPRSARFNVSDDVIRNVKPFGNIFGASFGLKNFNNFGVGKTAFSSGCHSSVSNSVQHVLGFTAPSQIVSTIIRGIPIKVATFKAGLFGAVKSFQNKMMNISHSNFAIDGKIDAGISLPVIAAFNSSQWDSSSNVAKTGNLINSIGSVNVKPLFVRDVSHSDVTFCLEVRDNNNFILSQSGAIVSNCIIIDDAHKASEARSDTIRKGVLDWFQTTLESRKNDPKNTPIIVIMQRLHENDLAGWLLEGGNGEKWEHICLPAIDDEGKPLWEAKHSLEELRRMEKANPYVFAGQYMQRPSPGDGGVFKPDNIQIVDEVPAGVAKWCRGWDFASTIDGDYTAGVKIGRMNDGRFVIADIVHDRLEVDARDNAIKAAADRDGRNVVISIPQDPGQAGKTQVAYLTRALAGFNVKSSPETGDKITRAEPFAAQVNVGNVLMVRAPWNERYISELRMFPFGSFDDQVDGSSRAFSEVMIPRRSWFG